MRVLLGVSGGIAAYKAAGIVRELGKRGWEVRVVMTRGAREFITPMTLQVLSGHPVGLELFDMSFESDIGHIELARWPDVILIAPATAHCIAKVRAGMADDLLTTVLLATTAPVVIAPAMNTQMYANARVQENIQVLGAQGYHIISPDSGELACKEVGAGRLPDPEVLVAGVRRAMGPALLAARRVLITAGPTREAIDAARFISNPSTGKMGYALASEAYILGARVTLVSGPVSLPAPAGVELVQVATAQQMHDAVMQRAASQDIVVKAAAVADWRPAHPSVHKRAKSEMDGTLELERTRDILAALGELYGPGQSSAGPMIVGYGAESHDVEERARAKLARKRAHWLVANQIGGASSAFGADVSSVALIHHDPEVPIVRHGPLPKAELAAQLWRTLARALDARPLSSP